MLSPPTLTAHVFSAAKDGAPASDWEDSAALSRASGRFAIADGASSSFAAKQWGRLLTSRWLSDPPANHADAWELWLRATRDVWTSELSSIESSVPSYLQRHRAEDSRGSHATFLGCSTTPLRDGIVGVQVTAIGDSCLFQVRDNQIVGCSPANLLSMEFDSYPTLLCSNEEPDEPVPLRTKLAARAGDTLYLASDAIAEALRDHHNTGAPVWQKLENVTNSDFLSLVAGLRDHGMTNDDVTLLRCKLGAPDPLGSDEVTL